MGTHLSPGAIVALIGDLGAGKTQLTKGLARGLELSEDYYITSPTYTIINEYPGKIPLYHFDLYRLEGDSEFEELGYKEYLDGRGVTVIEWAEKIIHLLPGERMEIYISHLKEDERRLEIIGYGMRYEKIVEQITRVFG